MKLTSCYASFFWLRGQSVYLLTGPQLSNRPETAWPKDSWKPGNPWTPSKSNAQEFWTTYLWIIITSFKYVPMNIYLRSYKMF